MALVLSHKERTRQFELMAEQLRNLARSSQTIDEIDAELVNMGTPLSSIITSIQASLTALSNDISSVTSGLSGLGVVHKAVVSIGLPVQYDGATIDAIDTANGNFGTVRVRSAKESLCSPFYGLQAGDIIVISDAEDATNNGTYTLRYTPQEVGSSVLSSDFTSLWTGDGSSHWTFTTTTATHASGNTTNLALAYADMVGEVDNIPYLLSFTLSGHSGTSFLVRFDSSENYLLVGADGDYEVIVYSDSGGSLEFIPSDNTAEGAFSNVSMVPFTGLALTEALAVDNALDTSLVISLEER
jgi:hypothetical protein